MTNLFCRVADIAARPLAQLGFIALCLAWLWIGYGVDLLTLALSMLAITLTQMVLAAQRRDTMALHAKLDGLIGVTDASNDLIRAEQKTEAEIDALRG